MEQIAKQKEIALSDAEEQLIKEVADTYYETLSDAELDYADVDKGKLESYYRRYALARKLYDEMSGAKNTEVSDDEARVIRIGQIRISDAAKADEVEKKLAQGEDFLSLAAVYNEADAVEITVARGDLPKEVEQVAFEMDNDEISGKITTADAYYYIACISKYEEELTLANKEVIVLERERKAFDDAYRDFVDSAQMVMNDEVWDKVTIAKKKDRITTSTFFSTYENAMTNGREKSVP